MRSTGSGMGCPDWPKCFGNWVPPTTEAQLPENYQEHYRELRLEKNARLTGYLESLGMNQLADRIANDPSIKEEQPFNPVKTWIEYVNRLIGVLIGLFIFVTLILSFRYWKHDRAIVWVCLGAFVLTGVQGWIGSIVVSTNLLHGMINVHLFLAIIIVNMLIYGWYRAKRHEVVDVPASITKNANLIIILSMIAMIAQIFLGVEVRAAVDSISETLGLSQRAQWIGSLGGVFKFHRSFSLAILLSHIALVRLLWLRTASKKKLFRIGRMLAFVTALEVVTGAVMGYFAIPAAMQPVHLLFATVIMGMQYYVFLLLNRKQNQAEGYPSLE